MGNEKKIFIYYYYYFFFDYINSTKEQYSRIIEKY